jgi:hypothetical protein
LTAAELRNLLSGINNDVIVLLDILESLETRLKALERRYGITPPPDTARMRMH